MIPFPVPSFALFQDPLLNADGKIEGQGLWLRGQAGKIYKDGFSRGSRFGSLVYNVTQKKDGELSQYR